MANKKPIKIKDKIEEKNIGRPTKMTPLTVKKLEEAFMLGCTDEEACMYAGITRQTLTTYQNENKEFLDRKQVFKQNPIFLARKSVVEELKNNPELALKYLERKKKDEFSTRSENINTEKPYVTTEEDEEMAKEAAMKVWGLVEKSTNSCK